MNIIPDQHRPAAVANGGGSVSAPSFAPLPDPSPRPNRIIEYPSFPSSLPPPPHLVLLTPLLRSPPPSAFADLVEQDLQQVRPHALNRPRLTGYWLKSLQANDSGSFSLGNGGSSSFVGNGSSNSFVGNAGSGDILDLETRIR